MYTMLRLTFFDGTGLDYAYTLVGNHPFLFFLTMCYMSITAFGIINGMVGIFATVFATASEDAFVLGWTDDDDGSTAAAKSPVSPPMAMGGMNLASNGSVAPEDGSQKDGEGGEEGAGAEEARSPVRLHKQTSSFRLFTTGRSASSMRINNNNNNSSNEVRQ